MKTKSFIMGAAILICHSLFSCNSFDETENISSHAQTNVKQTRFAYVEEEDANTLDFFNRVDELRVKYDRPAVYGLGTKLARSIANGIVDCSIGAFGAAIPFPGASLIVGSLASTLWDEYMDRTMLKLMKTDMKKAENLFAPDLSGPVDPSILDGVILNVRNSTIFLADTSKHVTFIDSIGCIHNELLTSLRKNGKKYIDSNGNMDYDGIYNDLFHIAFLNGYCKFQEPDSIADVILQKNDSKALHSAVRDFTISFINEFDPVKGRDFAESYDIARANSIDKLDMDKRIFDEIKSLGERIISTTSNLSTTETVRFCKELDTTINDSKLTKYQKDTFKALNNVYVNSVYYWK